MGGTLTSTTDSQKKESQSDIVPDEFKSSLSSSVVQVGTLPEFLDQWKSITSNRFVLHMV